MRVELQEAPGGPGSRWAEDVKAGLSSLNILPLGVHPKVQHLERADQSGGRGQRRLEDGSVQFRGTKLTVKEIFLLKRCPIPVSVHLDFFPTA